MMFPVLASLGAVSDGLHWAKRFHELRAMAERVIVRAPATSANMGPGFDCLGIALDIWNSVVVEVGLDGFEVDGEGRDTLRRDRSNLVYKSFCIPFQRAGRQVPKVHITCENEIPLGRGLGSSSAAAVAGLMAGNEVCGGPLSQGELLGLAAGMEGHPDNVSAALLGGCQIVVENDGCLVTSHVPVPPELKAVLFVPDVPMPTDRARKLLPRRIDRSDAVYNIGRVGLLVRALATGDLSHLAIATEDRLHQPARQTLFPSMKSILDAAFGAGALGAFLSGAGSSILALTMGKEVTIGYEMADAAAKSGVQGTIKITRPTEQGTHVVESH